MTLFQPLPFGLPDEAGLLLEASTQFTCTNTVVLPLLDWKQWCPLTAEALEDGMKAKLTKARMFITPAYHLAGIHIDGPSRQLCNRWAVNIPVANCTGTQFEYFEVQAGETVLSHYGYANSTSVRYDEKDVVRSLGALELTAPHLVCTDIPHRVINLNQTQRIIVSFRFDRSPVTSLDEELQRLSAAHAA